MTEHFCCRQRRRTTKLRSACFRHSSFSYNNECHLWSEIQFESQCCRSFNLLCVSLCMAMLLASSFSVRFWCDWHGVWYGLVLRFISMKGMCFFNSERSLPVLIAYTASECTLQVCNSPAIRHRFMQSVKLTSTGVRRSKKRPMRFEVHMHMIWVHITAEKCMSLLVSISLNNSCSRGRKQSVRHHLMRQKQQQIRQRLRCVERSDIMWRSET